MNEWEGHLYTVFYLSCILVNFELTYKLSLQVHNENWIILLA